MMECTADQVLGKTDFALVTQKPPVRESLNDILACEYPFRLFAAEEYLKKHGAPTCFDDLRNHHLITCSESMRLRVQSSKMSPGFLEIDEEMASIAKEKPMVVDNGLNALFAVKKGMGMALLPLFYQEMVELINLEDEKTKIGHLKSQKYIVYSKALEGSKRHEVFLEYLKDAMKTLS